MLCGHGILSAGHVRAQGLLALDGTRLIWAGSRTGRAAVALHLRGQEHSRRDIAGRLVISTGKKKGQHPSPATVMRMLRERDEKAAEAAVTAGS